VPLSFYVDENTGVIHVQAIGEVNDAEVVELSDHLRHEVAFLSGYPILCDGASLTAVLISSSLLESLGRTTRLRTNFVAIIAPSPAAFGLARMYQILSDPEDTRMRVFTEAEDAMAWLKMRVEEPPCVPGHGPVVVRDNDTSHVGQESGSGKSRPDLPTTPSLGKRWTAPS
jgi:hypothetical protein